MLVKFLINGLCPILDKGHHLLRIPDRTHDFKDVTLAYDEGQQILAHSGTMNAA